MTNGEAIETTEPDSPGRSHRKLALALIVLASRLSFLAAFALWANRQVLNTDNWTETSSELIENDAIRTQVANFLVAEMYANVDVKGELEQIFDQVLRPAGATALAGPAANDEKYLPWSALGAVLWSTYTCLLAYKVGSSLDNYPTRVRVHLRADHNRPDGRDLRGGMPPRETIRRSDRAGRPGPGVAEQARPRRGAPQAGPDACLHVAARLGSSPRSDAWKLKRRPSTDVASGSTAPSSASRIPRYSSSEARTSVTSRSHAAVWVPRWLVCAPIFH